MKFKFLYIIILSGCMTGSCTLDYSPLSGPTTNNFPANTDEATAGLFAAYKLLSTMDASNVAWLKAEDNITDIGVTRVNTPKFTELTNSSASGNNAIVNSIYTVLFQIINRVNIVLDKLNSGNIQQDKMSQLKVELLCLRAYCYDLGCQYFGDLPYIEHNLPLLHEPLSRVPKNEIIKNILNDLNDEQLNMLPLRFDHGLYGTARIGRVAAYGLRARIALEWGDYTLAASSSHKALAYAQQAGYTLQKLDLSNCGVDHTKGEPVGTVALFGYKGHAESNEWIWCIQYNRQINGNTEKEAYYQLSRPAGGCSYFGPTQSLIDMFQCTDGKSISESPLYDWKNPWKNRDPRLDLYCVRPGSRLYNLEFETSNNIKQIINYNTGTKILNIESQGTKGVYGANGNKGPGGYLWRKHIDIAELQNGAITSSSLTDMNCGIMRLAELYLIEAEANIEMENGNLQLAQNDINIIRARVNMPPITLSSKSDLRKALRYERTVELCDEGFRWFDLRRWNIADRVMNGRIYAPSQTGEMSNAKPVFDENWCPHYGNTTWDGKKLNLRVYNTYTYKKGKDELWPIPQTELDTNPLFKQNNGF